MKWLRYFLVIVAILTVSIFSPSPTDVSALDVPPAPSLEMPILDQTDTLSETEKTTLASTINAERAESGNEIAVLMIPTLADESLEDYSIRVARAWGIGTSERNNGILLLIAKDDRKLRIEVGYGLEGALPDARASQIIRNVITPEFKKGQYFNGINLGVNNIITSIQGEYQAPSEGQRVSGNIIEQIMSSFELLFLFFFFIPLWIASILARSKSWWAGGIIGGVIGIAIGLVLGFVFAGIVAIAILTTLGLVLDWLVSRNFQQRKRAGLAPSWWAGGTRIGGGGGGGSFGGGSFGGGGSSGSW